MAAKNNLTMTIDVQVTAREIDFVTRFARNWQHLRDILGIMRPIKKQPGTVLKSKTASVTLAQSVGEGEEIPYLTILQDRVSSWIKAGSRTARAAISRRGRKAQSFTTIRHLIRRWRPEEPKKRALQAFTRFWFSKAFRLSITTSSGIKRPARRTV